MTEAAGQVLALKDLTLGFRGYTGYTKVLHGISLDINAGERVALVGESGSGKSVTARIILGLLQQSRTARISGEVKFRGRDMSLMNPEQRRALRGTDISMIFQDPTSALNPTFTIGNQFTEVLRRRDNTLSRDKAEIKAAEWLESVSIHDTDRVLSAYSFQLSGGMNQRVMIAMALANTPSLLIADEPGTALDVTVQAQTLALMQRLITEQNTSLLFISHNLGVVREFSDRVNVIYRGRIVEYGSTDSVFNNPQHPYTRALMQAVPDITGTGIPEIGEDTESFLSPCINHSESSTENSVD